MRLKRILVASALLLLIGAGFCRLAVAAPEITRCYLVRWSTLDRVAPDLYVDANMPEAQKQELEQRVDASKERVSILYGEYTAAPVIIAGHTMDVMNAYGGNPFNRAGQARISPVATFIILGPNGTRSVDVLSHELAHAELSARIGYWRRGKVPNWFDEGLAVYFDDRYSEAEWRARTDDGKSAPSLDEIGVIKFNDWLGYATAKHEVGRWLDAVGQEGFLAFLEAIRGGSEFQEAYHSIEQAYATIR